MSSDINVQTFSGKVNITSNLLVGSSHLFVDTINNRVGLVTNTPDAGLHVSSNAYVHTDFRVGSGIVMNDTTGRITAGSFVGDGSAMTGINSDSGSWVNGTDVVYLSTIGDKVGIGTTDPATPFHISSTNEITSSPAGSNVSQMRYGTTNSTVLFGVSSTAGHISAYDTSNFSINRQLCLNADGGNVGIGTTSPGQKLSIYTGNTAIAGLSIDRYSTGNYRTEFYQADTGLAIHVGNASDAPTEKMRIHHNGNVGIGTTSPGAPLDVFAPVASGTQRTALRLTTPESASGTGCNLDFFQDTANVGRLASVYEAAGQLGMAFSTWNGGLGERVRIDASGNVGIGVTDPDGTLHVKAENRVHITAGTVPAFTGLNAVSEGRAQLVLASRYSDLVIASSYLNNAHGSTLSFAAVNPSNTAEYRKFVINQGNWGSRMGFLDFGISSSASDPNPHLAINSTDTVLTLDGNNKRVGIGTTSPGEKLHVNGTIKASLLSMNGYTMSKPPRVVHIDDSRSGCPPTQAANTNIMEYSLSLARTAYVYVSVTTILEHTARADCHIYFGGSIQQSHLTSTDNSGWNPVNITAGGTIGAGTTVISFRCSTANVVGCQTNWGGMQILIFET